MNTRFLALGALLGALIAVPQARADVVTDRFSAAGYFRVMTRPDFQGGDSQLGYWNLYGRLLNEGPYAALELRLDMLRPEPGRDDPWASVHARIEGGSVMNGHPALGRLDNFALTQLYVRAGNIGLENVTWQLGTLDYWYGVLGLHDMRPAQLFFETLGLSALYQTDKLDLLVGVGDSGYFMRREQYNTLLTGGVGFRFRPANGFEFGLGGQFFLEPEVRGNRFAPYATPGIRYEDFFRREVVQTFLETNPGMEDFFVRPQSRSSLSAKLVGYVGFGDFGPLRWNSLYFNLQRRHPENFYVENFEGRDYTIYTRDLTDQRYELNVGDEAQFTIVPRLLDAVVAGVLGHHWDNDNDIAPTDFDRTFVSGVLRLQLYLTETIHLLGETSIAREISNNGNRYRTRSDSVFDNTGGVADTRGLEYGDTDTRKTWQGKLGVVLNPTGMGIYTRPSIRLLYGVQHSNQNVAFGNSFVETLDEFNDFGSPEQHWHHLVALEAETWF